MDIVYYLVASVVISFLGTLPIGLITLTIAQRTITQGKNAGMKVALGATIMEFVYTFIAVKALDFFNENVQLNQSIKIASAILFLMVGLYLLFKKPKKEIEIKGKESYKNFIAGLIVGTMNFLIVPFWIFFGLLLESYGMVFENYSKLVVFSIGSALGALLGFILYIWFSALIKEKLTAVTKYTNKIFGILFLILSLVQFLQLI